MPHDCDNLVEQLKEVHTATYGHISPVGMKVLAAEQDEILPVL